MTIFRAEFQQHIQKATHGRFSIPRQAADAANLSSGDTVMAEITIGSEHYFGPIQLTSGLEVLLPTKNPLYQSALPSTPLHVTLIWEK
jgi:hypothetical protein